MGSDAQQDTTRCATGPQRGSRHVFDAGTCVRCGASSHDAPLSSLAADAVSAMTRIEMHVHQVLARAGDPELAAMRALSDLDNAARERVLTWALARWGSR